MTLPFRFVCLRFVVPALIVLSSTPSVAGVRYVSAVTDDTNVVVTAITDSYYAMAASHTAYATAWVKSPSGRTSQNTYYQRNRVSVTTILPLNMEDGIFEIANLNPREWCPFAQTFIALVTLLSQINEPPFIKLYNTAVNPAEIESKNATSRFSVQVATSPGCGGVPPNGGNVVVHSWVLRLVNETDATITAPKPDGDGIDYEHSTNALKTIPPSSGYTFNFDIKTTKDNTIGSTTLSAYAEILSRPDNCLNVKGPSPGGFSNSRDIKIKAAPAP